MKLHTIEEVLTQKALDKTTGSSPVKNGFGD